MGLTKFYLLHSQHYIFRPQRAIIRCIYQICYIAVMLFIYYRRYVVVRCSVLILFVDVTLILKILNT
jgi:hypothetical protein